MHRVRRADAPIRRRVRDKIAIRARRRAGRRIFRQASRINDISIRVAPPVIPQSRATTADCVRRRRRAILRRRQHFTNVALTRVEIPAPTAVTRGGGITVRRQHRRRRRRRCSRTRPCEPGHRRQHRRQERRREWPRQRSTTPSRAITAVTTTTMTRRRRHRRRHRRRRRRRHRRHRRRGVHSSRFDDALCVECESRAERVGVDASDVGVKRSGRVFGHSASVPNVRTFGVPEHRRTTHDARAYDDDDDERGTGARVRHRGRHTHHGCISITAAATTITASVDAHECVDGESACTGARWAFKTNARPRDGGRGRRTGMTMHAGERRVMSLDEGWGSMQVRAGVRSRCWCGTTWGRDVRHQGGYARRGATRRG